MLLWRTTESAGEHAAARPRSTCSADRVLGGVCGLLHPGSTAVAGDRLEHFRRGGDIGIGIDVRINVDNNVDNNVDTDIGRIGHPKRRRRFGSRVPHPNRLGPEQPVQRISCFNNRPLSRGPVRVDRGHR